MTLSVANSWSNHWWLRRSGSLTQSMGTWVHALLTSALRNWLLELWHLGNHELARQKHHKATNLGFWSLKLVIFPIPCPMSFYLIYFIVMNALLTLSLVLFPAHLRFPKYALRPQYNKLLSSSPWALWFYPCQPNFRLFEDNATLRENVLSQILLS